MADQTNVPADETGVANPYLETLQSSLATGAAPAAAGGNPYLSMLEDAEELRRVRMSANVTDAVTVNPDQYAAQRKVAKYLGYPPAAVEAMPDITKQQAQVKAVQQAAATSPVLERRYSDADFAKLAHDDTGTLSQVAGWFTSGARYVFSAPDARNTLAGDIGASAYDASRGVAGVLQAGADLLAPLFDPLAGTVLPENPLRRLSAGMAEAGAAAKRTGDRLSPPSGDVVQGGVSSGVRSLGQNALMLPLALLPGGQGAALGGMTGMAGGQAYQQAREAGLPLSQALPFAASQAAIEYATEKLPLEQLIGSVKAGAPVLRTLAQQAGLEIPGEQIATVLQDMNEWAVLPENKDKPFSAYIAERPNAAAQTLIATVVGVGGNVAIAQGVERLVGDAEARQQAQADQQRVAELFALAGQSRLRERSPDSFAEVVQEMADQSDAPKEVRFDARTLVDVLQQAGVDEAQLVEMLPSVLPQLQEALSTGGEVTVPLGEFSKVVGTELEQTLLDNARIGQNELSQAEAKAAGEQAAQLMQEQAQRIAEQATNSVAVMAGNDAVKTTVLDQLNSTKRFTADVNEAYATLVANFYTVMGGRLGVTADQLYAQYPLRVQGEGVGDLDQPAYHGSPHRGIEQFTTQKIGTGEGAQAYGWGMYFAGSKDIAEFYRKGLSYREIVREFRAELPDNADFDDALAAAETMSPERARAIRALAANDWLGFDYPSQAITAAFKELDYYDPSDELRDAVNAARGQLYTVEVPHDGDLLDYDAPLDEQPEKVRKALEALGFPAEQYRLRRTFGATMFFPSREAARQHVKESNDAGVIEPVPSRKDGKTIYGEIVAKLGSPEAASRALFAAGIPGLRYLDAGSRGAKADGKSWNYVIFDDSAVRKTGELYQGGNNDVTQTDAFKRWFGDSKVVDANGEPLVVYHGTQASVDAFNTRGGTGKTSGTGSFFTDNPKTADTYAGGEGGNVAPVYLSLQHPAVIDAQGANWNAIPQKAKVYLPKVDVSDQEVRKTLKAKNTNVRGLFAGEWDYPDDTASTDDIARWARNAGYDGVVVKNVRDRGPSGDFQSEEARAPSTVYVAFRPEQIKSAIGNSGAFDPNDPSILNQGPRGTFNPSNLTISLLEKADLSTFLHETGHFFMVSLFNMASQPNAPSAIADDVSTLLKWFGVKDMETWNGMTLEQQRKSHERFAESFEQYLLEGKAPSLELQPLFSRFLAWLINVYRSLTDFLRNRDTQLSDEVRAVFDRLIATEQQIQQAQAIRRYEPLFRSAEQAGMTPQQWAAYQSQGQRATDTAMDQLQARSLRDMRWTTNARSRALKALQKDVAGKRKAVEAEVRAEVEQQAIYQAMRWLRKGEMTTPEGEEIKAEKGFRLNTDALAEMYPEPMLGRPDMERLKGMTAGNGLHPDMVAEMFGFESGDHLVRALIDAHPMASVVEGMTDQRLLERFGDLVTESGIQRAADEAVHNEARARFVASELKALQAAQGQTARTAAGGNVNVMVRAAKQFAENLIAQRKVRELKPGQHTAAETRAARNAERALVKGDTQGAIVAKRDQLLNHYAARVTNDTLAEIERAVEYLKKFDKEATRKKLPPEYLDQIDKLLERVDLRQVSNRALDKRAKLAAWIEEQKAMGVEPEIPDYLLEDAQLTSYRGMQVEAFRGLVDTVKQIEHLGRVKNKLLTAKDQREFAAIRDSIAQSILDNAGNRTADSRTPTTNLGRALGAVKQFGAAHVKAATWARILDGGKDGGPVWEYFIRSANEAGDTETGLVAKATADLSKIMAPLLERSKLGGKGRYFQSIGRSLNRESVLAIALNVGNESNLQRLMGGEGWSPAQVKDILDTLQPEDWKAVQAIWDYFETFRPLIAEKEKRVFGREPKWIEPGSYFTETYGVKGGYYPIKYDPAASQRAEEHADAEGAKRQLQGAYGAATTKRSFTKSRAEEVSGRPLLYTLSGVYSGVNEVIHDLSWHEWLIDVNRLLRSKQIDAAIREKYGPEVVRQFKAWRDDIAEGDAAPQRALDMALGRLRQSVSVAGLGFNVVSAMMQPLGLAQSIQRVGPRWVGRGLMDFIGSPLEAGREVNEKSKFMANRARTRFRELNELRNRVQGQSALKRAINENAYRLMMAFQRMVDVPTWLGAYEKAITDGQDEKRAVALADQTVIDSQGGGQTKDLSAIERGPQALKLFTTFYSFMNTALNLGVASKMTPRSRARFAADMLLLYVVPAVLGSMLKDAITPGDGGDDDEALARKLAAEQLSYLLGMVVIGREFGQVAQTVTGAGSRDYTGPAGVRAIADVYQFAKQAGQGEFDDSFRKATINLAGDLFGLPSAQINRSVTGIQALTEGKTANPAAVVFGYQEPR